MSKKKLHKSIILNSVIIILTIIAVVIMFTGFKFMHGKEPILDTTKLGVLKFFTVDSNILMGIASFIFVIYEKKVLNGKMKRIPLKCYILKLVATTSVALTFLVTFLYLRIVTPDGIISLLQNSNLFFHLIIPVLSIIAFIFYEKRDNFKIKYVGYSVLPVIIYGIFYIFNIIIHLDNGMVSPIYDWYYFTQGGIWQMLIIGPLMIFITYCVGLSLWELNRHLS